YIKSAQFFFRALTLLDKAIAQFRSMNSDTLQSLWTDERIRDLVRKLRNDLIKDFLDERILVPWLKDRYQVPDLSPVKVQLIRKELKTLLISPVDIHHYQS